ncbi:MAG TPA: hypothetical protein PLU72_04520 [Candidatus Ozemobacteraceae bacterium]|nr:hypothetical protein [Candidatus Ozemobacteraceae bacterium]
MNFTGRRQGMAIPLVLLFATVLAVIGTVLIKTTRQTSRQNLTSYNQLQAHFVARAGMEHALLKIKYLQRELYDAICLSQGRNPLYDFSRPIGPTNPGPAFLYTSGEFSPNGFFTPNFSKPNFTAWIQAFTEDLVSGTTIDGVQYNSCLSFTSPPAAVSGLMREHFTGGYTVSTVGIAANNTVEQSAIVNNQSIVEVTVGASITSARNETWDATLKRTVRVSRDNAP